MTDKHLHSKLNAYQANKMRSDWMKSLAKACGQPIDDSAFLPLDQTKKLKDDFFAIVKEKRNDAKQWWKISEKQQMQSFFANLAQIVGDHLVILFSFEDKNFGAVRIPASCIIRNPIQVWQITKEDLAFAFEDLSSGICLEQNFYEADGKYVAEGIYELTAWGIFARTCFKTD
jgi:hypothetical protein